MAQKPLRPCRHPGCTTLVTGGYCDLHRPKDSRSDAAKSWHWMYLTPEWTEDLRPGQLLREPFCRDAQAIFLLCANRQYEGFLTAKSVTDIYYLTHRQTHSEKTTRDVLKKLCTLFGLLDTRGLDIRKAISDEISDFEDAVMIETAIRSGMDCIVTRNIRDYKNAFIPVYTPEEFLELLARDQVDKN